MIPFFKSLNPSTLNAERKALLMQLVLHMQTLRKKDKEIRLNFICTHNSRRSQLSQVLAKAIADQYNIPVATYSGGVEVTACNERVIQCLNTLGFTIKKEGDNNNPKYTVGYQNRTYSVLYSKIYDDKYNPKENFVAVMTCDHADENCPFIPGSDLRIPIRYTDPKVFDDTPNEENAYLEKAQEIALEMKFIFEQLSQK